MALTAPFVLLDDARPDGTARLYRDPVRVLATSRVADIAPMLAEIRAATRAGLHAAGFLAYGASPAFEAKAPPSNHDPLLWFGLFEGHTPFDPASLPDPRGAWVGAAKPSIDRATYQRQVAAVQALIAAGDIYQANLTFQASVSVEGDPLAAYARLRAASRAGWGAVVATGDATYLSLSPELFFALDAGKLVARPMKGTTPRLCDPGSDDAAAAALQGDPKQRAENLMIVDLMRNDLSRIAVPGSVAVPELFAVERYPTVQQMVSTVTADLAPRHDAIDVVSALFPCGSITGAPKLRAMQAIADIEAAPRGLYTGAIGRFDPNGDAQFNVAIRTLTLRGDEATLGLGSGIVADSVAADEWDECLAKGAFLTAAPRTFDLIETMRFDPREGIALLERHLERLKASAQAFGFPFDRHATRNELQAATFRLECAAKVRLLLAPGGAVAIEVAPLPPTPTAPVEVALVPHRVAAADFRLRHKTSDRAFYDEPRRAAACFEVAFIDAAGFVTEGSFTSIFVERDGLFVTPPLSRGLLPGVLRAELLATGRAIEGDLTPVDLAHGFWIGNAVRGLVSAVTVANPSGASV
ncbi:aminodeoxychorismate synthase component I [Sphingomonas sp. S1-29]|uniref:aminodeoxychorismate synthase component I n=1 Tax=Sphingomonas sp. S1-29 TaxID=2991074 RepID=UPI0022406DED|nr:aminodeoxychorismate synthase component I [Sphingomonas sp. S1-29]UZK71073.1 aminodeoxychorismate synthase component I [Sphingomonas sp. S1-29]